jgi:hydrogenase maturation protease
MSADCNRRPILILGIGNILLRDEGVGVRVIEQMQKMHLPEDVELVDGGTAGADLLNVLAERKKVIVIDAIQADCEPGTVLRFSANDLVQPDGVGTSLHEIGLGEALTMTKQLGCAPKEIVVFGIKPKDISCGLELSEQISGTVSRIVELLLAEITNAKRHPFRE